MTDIVERLRKCAAWDGTPPQPKWPSDKEVIDEIERLRALLKEREWRPVDSNMAKDGSELIVCYDAGWPKVRIATPAYWDERHQCWRNRYTGIGEAEVIAYQPLPSPPSEDKGS